MPEMEACPVCAEASGYVQTIDRDGLVAAAEEYDLLVKVLRRPGDFVSRGDAVLHVWAAQKDLADVQAGQLRRAFSLGPRRTPTQDARYGVRQLTEIAARALSPGINDPFTAMGCADWLADALAEMAGREPPSGIRRGAGGRPRFLEKPVGFAELATLGFDPLRAYGAESGMVTVHVLNVLARLAAQVERREDRAALLGEAEQIAVAARQALGAESDLQRVGAGLDQIRAVLAARETDRTSAASG